MPLRIASLARFGVLPVLVLIVVVLGCARETPPAETGAAGAPRTSATSPAEAASVTPADVQAMRSTTSPPVMLDVRSPVEFADGHVAGSIHIPYEEVASRLAEIPDGGTIVVYCAVGPRARAAEASLVAAGVDPARLRHMEGGMVAWEAAGLPVER